MPASRPPRPMPPSQPIDPAPVDQPPQKRPRSKRRGQPRTRHSASKDPADDGQGAASGTAGEPATRPVGRTVSIDWFETTPPLWEQRSRNTTRRDPQAPPPIDDPGSKNRAGRRNGVHAPEPTGGRKEHETRHNAEFAQRRIAPGSSGQVPLLETPIEQPHTSGRTARKRPPVHQEQVPNGRDPITRSRTNESPARLACACVPLFPLAARLRCEPDLIREAVAVFEGNGAQARVVAATRLARQAGVRAGMTLAQARARMPKLLARARDRQSERIAQEVLLEVAESFTPRIEDPTDGVQGSEDPGTVYLDIQGLARHWRHAERPPELELAQALTDRLQAVGLPARVGIASSKLAARVAAGLPRAPHLVPTGEEADFLAPLPLHQLSPEATVLQTLERWGIQSIGELAALPRDEVASRLGDHGQRLHQTARGLDSRPLVVREPLPSLREGMTLEWPVVQLEPFLFIARTALERLCARLDQRGLGCKQLEISLQLEPDGFHERTIELPSPTREARTLLTLLRLDLEAHTPQSPITRFQLTAHPDRPKLAQLSLLGPASLSPDRLATTLARLFALLGPGRVGSPRPSDGHRPERFQLVEYTPPPPPKVRTRIEPGRGLLSVRVLRPPLALEVITDEVEPAPITAAGSHEVHEAGPVPWSPEDQEAIEPSPTETSAQSASGSDPVVVVEDLSRQAGLFRRCEQLRARPVEITSEAQEKGRPKIQGAVRVASGPWELEEQWWTPERTERDYWDIELTDGGIYRVYYERRQRQWFADGIYD